MSSLVVAKKIALRCLARRAYYSKELAKKLQEKGVSNLDIQGIIQEFQEAGYLNDQEWVDSFVRVNLAKKDSKQSIAWKLKKKGVDGEIIQQAMNQQEDQTDQTTILRLLDSRYRSKDLTSYIEKQKVIASLVRKGFTLNDINLALQKSLPSRK